MYRFSVRGGNFDGERHHSHLNTHLDWDLLLQQTCQEGWVRYGGERRKKKGGTNRGILRTVSS